MKQSAIEHAKDRLDRARDAVKRMEEAKSPSAIEKPWSDFLHSAGGIYSKLEQGAKGCGVSEGWFGRKKHDRKKDQLLSYLHHARNSDEHGIMGTTLQHIEFKVLNDKLKGIKMNRDADGNAMIQPVGEGAEIEILNKGIRLKAVTDGRYGDTFMPPREHLVDRI